MLTLDEALVTDRLRLRPFATDDAADAHSYLSLADVVRYLYWEVRSREEVDDLVATRSSLRRLERDGDHLVLAVERIDDGRVIGEVNLRWASVEHQQGEIGFVFHPDVHGHGYAREAAERLLALAFDDLGLHRVYGRTDGRNDASAGLMRRLGMRQEAHFVHNEVFKGEWGDELVFAMLDDEWRAGQGTGRSYQRTSQ